MAEGPFRDIGPGRRKSPRRAFHFLVKVIGSNAAQWDGFIVDISETGAQLELFDAATVPEQFSLLIGGHGAVNRLCHVVWRSQDRLGVKFLRGPERIPSPPTGRA